MNTRQIFTKGTSFSMVFFLLIGMATAQTPAGTLVKDIEYTFNQSDGTNACAVAWNPNARIYITVIAGNEGFPLEGFNTSAEMVFSAQANFDYRGLWYNPATKQMEGNGAGELGWTTFSLNANNTPSSNLTIYEGQHQPDFQSVGSYNDDKKQVVFLNPDFTTIQLFSRDRPRKIKKITLKWGDVSTFSINNNTLGYTGVKGFEYVVLDYVSGKLIFFNGKGAITATRSLPEGAPLNDSFAFSFANGHAFLYDKSERTWYGYKVF